ncbi:MAG TPA: winged helix-turn-helix domain-containing protein [Candidatus Tectomicrobia bacterium]|nr:winged helix-turn-helix domain-containing protein [Candidatus Tectomicrobia bacterium]
MRTGWTLRDVGALLAHHHAVQVSTPTLHRALWHLGTCHRRPRHDLQHRQDPQAVAGTRQVLDWLTQVVLPEALAILLTGALCQPT